MKFIRLGTTGVQVSRFCLGTNNFGGQVSREEVMRIIRQATDLGINLIDTADVYTQGKSEELIGEAIQGERDELLIATKVGWATGEERGPSPLSRKRILRHVEESLRRLRTDYIDIYFLHKFDRDTPLEETLRALDFLVKEGRVKHVACSNFTIAQVEETRRICAELGLEQLAVVEPQYNLLERGAETELLPYLRRNNLGVLTYSPLAGGFLTGKYRSVSLYPEGSRATYNSRFRERVDGQNFDRLEALLEVAREAGVPLHHLALAWVLRNEAVNAAIVGASKAEQLADCCQALEVTVSNEVADSLDKMRP